MLGFSMFHYTALRWCVWLSFFFFIFSFFKSYYINQRRVKAKQMNKRTNKCGEKMETKQQTKGLRPDPMPPPPDLRRRGRASTDEVGHRPVQLYSAVKHNLHISSFLHVQSWSRHRDLLQVIFFFFNKVVQNNTFYSLYKNNSPAVK